MPELGPSGFPPGPFYFAKVFDGEDVFGPHFYRNDLIVLRYDYEQDETGKPTLIIEVINPRTGLIGAGKPDWCWFSVYNYRSYNVVGADGNTYAPGTVVPLFHGRILSIPTSLLDETITIEYQTFPDDFVMQKQQVAELLKAGPGYDPIWLDDEHRDDPDSILQGYSQVWSVNPITMLVTTTDVIVGEDGIRTFTEADVPYDSVKETISTSPPLQTIRLEATVGWKQTSTGVLNFGSDVFVSLTGDSLIAGWPHAGTSLGGGWSVDAATARDVSGTAYIVSGSSNTSFNNQQKFHFIGDLMSESISITWPTGGAIAQVATLNLFQQIGLQSVGQFVDGGGNPVSVNIPFIYDEQLFFVYAWIIGTSLSLRYQADRDYKEILNITLQANVQQTVVNPTIQQESELIKLPGVDVGQPLINVLSWLTVAGQHVEVGTVVEPTSSATAFSGSTISQSPQICVQAGVAGTVEPNFSDVIGQYTTDGTVRWVCASTNLEPIPWQAIADVPTGQLLIPILPSPLDSYANYVRAGHIDEPIPTGSEIGTGWFATSGGALWQCMQGGTTSPFSSGPSAHDGQVIWNEVGANIPDGTVIYLCVNGGLTSSILPNFNPTLGAVTTEVGDGTFGGGSGVQWLSLGPVVAGKFAIPIGGTPGNVVGRTFFPTDRGQQAIVAALSRMVARLRFKARVVDISWDVNDYFAAIGMTTRMNAGIEDYRISGGAAEGKVVNVRHGCNGDTGIQYGTIKIAATVGTGGHVTESAGQDTYAIDYATDYTQSVNQIVVPLDDFSVGYQPLSAQPNDDGLIFPLSSPSQVAVVNETVGSLEDQIAAIQPWVAGTINMAYVSNHNPSVSAMQAAAFNLQRVNPSLLMVGHEVYKDLRLRPVAGNSFINAFLLSVTELTIPQTINLSGTSHG
jgi:hypothetical protein